jgi:hypothetical protein
LSWFCNLLKALSVSETVTEEYQRGVGQYKLSQKRPIIFWRQFRSRARAEVFWFHSEMATCEFFVNAIIHPVNGMTDL